jgi:hypothetical protein
VCFSCLLNCLGGNASVVNIIYGNELGFTVLSYRRRFTG